MDRRMQCLYASVEDFRETGVFRNLLNFNPIGFQKAGCPAGGNNFNPQRLQPFGKIQKTGLVGNTDEGAFDFDHRYISVAEKTAGLKRLFKFIAVQTKSSVIPAKAGIQTRPIDGSPLSRG